MLDNRDYQSIKTGQLRKWILESPTDPKCFLVVGLDEGRVSILERDTVVTYSWSAILYQSRAVR